MNTLRASTPARRGLRLALVGAIASAGIAATTGAAYAADQLDVGINPYGLQLPAVMNGVSVTKTLQISIYHDQQEKVGTAAVTIDASGLSRTAQVIWPSGCTHRGDVGTCAKVHIYSLGTPGSTWTYLNLGLKALPGVKNGAQGTVSVTASAPGLGSQTASAPVSVGVGADLVAGQLPELKKVKVGTTLRAPISWTNTGDETAPRTQVTLSTMPGLSFEQHLKNCVYSDKGTRAVCVVNTPVKPGQTLRFPAPVALSVTKQAWYAFMPVSITPLGAGRAAAPADLNSNDSYTELDVYAVNTAHFAAIGATVRGAAGQTIPVTVGMRSYGPAYIFDRSGGEGVGQVEVTFPQGTTVTRIPQNCVYVAAAPAESPLPARYNCWIPLEVAPGQEALYTFSVKVDKVIANATSRVWLGTMGSDMTGKPVVYNWDPTSAGHTSTIVLNPTSAR